MYKNFRSVCLGLIIIAIMSSTFSVSAKVEQAQKRIISLNEFIALATSKDTVFEEILIDELSIKYNKDLKLPARDLVLSVKADYDIFFSQNREEPAAFVSLNKLFTKTATEVSATYSSKPSLSSIKNNSEWSLMFSQPIARNAFGKQIRLLDSIADIENELALYQIVEAYEDYLSSIIQLYHSWYEAYENKKIAESSYSENLKLLENIKERKRNSIALDVDVNKTNIQVLAKKEKLILFSEAYTRILVLIKKAIRYDDIQILLPKNPDLFCAAEFEFSAKYSAFKDNSRTYSILNSLSQKSSLDLYNNAQELLPSINLFGAYSVLGKDFKVIDEDNIFAIGISMDWPIGNQKARAEYELAMIAERKVELNNRSIYESLYSDLIDLYSKISEKRKIIAITEERAHLAQLVLDDETENYTYGKISLNDFIQSVNLLDEHRFAAIKHNVELKKLLIEWLRLTDMLVPERESIDIYTNSVKNEV